MAERLDDVAAWTEPDLVASVDGVDPGDHHRGRATSDARRHLLGTADRLQPQKLILDGRYDVLASYRAPHEDDGNLGSIKQSFGSSGAATVFIMLSVDLTTLHLISPIVAAASQRRLTGTSGQNRRRRDGGHHPATRFTRVILCAAAPPVCESGDANRASTVAEFTVGKR
ncbi:hypothetical protein [Mycolicibacterium agri]|uniref:hypothetical protein n=1 Tax=Mycolicibacterium agri TaxID=36811 RepID=UPI0013D6923D|nr:hypothetical protein [Mycolicibacterium agri]